MCGPRHIFMGDKNISRTTMGVSFDVIVKSWSRNQSEESLVFSGRYKNNSRGNTQITFSLQISDFPQSLMIFASDLSRKNTCPLP